MKILICSMTQKRADDILDAIKMGQRNVITVTICAEKDLSDHLRSFFKYTDSFTEKNIPSVFRMAYDILFFDCTDMEPMKYQMGYIRAFGRISYVVLLNENPHMDFDTEHVVGSDHSYADMVLNTRDLANPVLWHGIPNGKFAPWYWPVLNHVAKKRKQQVKFVYENWRTPFVRAFKIPKPKELYRSAQGEILRSRKSWSSVTFRSFFLESCDTIKTPHKKQMIKNESCFNAVFNTVAGELDWWFRRLLASNNGNLVDLPHMFGRFPWVLQSPHKLSEYNSVVKNCFSESRLSNPLDYPGCYGLSKLGYNIFLKPFQFLDDCWTKAPSFWWRKMQSDDRQIHIRLWGTKLSDIKLTGVAFCEDTSYFMNRDLLGHEIHEFATGYHQSAYSWLIVNKLDGYKYIPALRIEKSMNTSKSL